MSRLTPEERAKRIAVIEEARAANVPWRLIAAALGEQEESLRSWWHYKDGPKVDRGARWECGVKLQRGETLRRCMACQAPFASSGVGHRLCNTHRLAGSPSPYAPDPGGSVGRQVGARRA